MKVRPVKGTELTEFTKLESGEGNSVNFVNSVCFYLPKFPNPHLDTLGGTHVNCPLLGRDSRPAGVGLRSRYSNRLTFFTHE